VANRGGDIDPTFMEVLDTSIANVALSHIAGGLGANADESTWVLTSYLVASAVILPASAWLSGVMGRKRFYLLCVALFTASSFLCGIAPNLQSLIVFRMLQGLGGGGMAPSEQSMLADTFPPEKRAQAFALYGLAVIVAPTVGPALGGYISDTWSWHWIFLINVPIGVISLVLVSWLVSEPQVLERERRERLKGGSRLTSSASCWSRFGSAVWKSSSIKARKTTGSRPTPSARSLQFPSSRCWCCFPGSTPARIRSSMSA
jgi:DHA2 family multidrug resistance protein